MWAKSLKEIILPDLGEGIEGAEVSEVSVAVGDTLSQGDTIVVLESDKASMEIPSDDDGVVKEVLVATGKEVNVGDLLIILEIEQSSPSKDFKEVKSLCVLIGPEGDFTPKERETILSKTNTIPFSLSNNILRADTATISAISLINFVLSDH